MTYDEIMDLTDYMVGELYDKEEIAQWGGAFFTQKKGEPLPGYNNARYMGFKTKEAAVKDTLSDKFGNDTLGKLCLKLLLKAPKPRKRKNGNKIT